MSGNICDCQKSERAGDTVAASGCQPQLPQYPGQSVQHAGYETLLQNFLSLRGSAPLCLFWWVSPSPTNRLYFNVKSHATRTLELVLCHGMMCSCLLSFLLSFVRVFSSSLSLCGVRDWTQGPIHARQMLS